MSHFNLRQVALEQLRDAAHVHVGSGACAASRAKTLAPRLKQLEEVVYNASFQREETFRQNVAQICHDLRADAQAGERWLLPEGGAAVAQLIHRVLDLTAGPAPCSASAAPAAGEAHAPHAGSSSETEHLARIQGVTLKSILQRHNDPALLADADVAGDIRCPKRNCRSDNVAVAEEQRKSADEPADVVCLCLDCGNGWVIRSSK